MEALERQVQALEAENNSLRTQLAVLTNEKENWNNKEKEMREQIRTLEQRLYDTHRLLSERISRRGDE
jgi:predicted  nucleic acid-binding Zn-ribbon protein